MRSLFNVATIWPKDMLKTSVRHDWIVTVLGSIIAPGFLMNTICFRKFNSTRSQSLVHRGSWHSAKRRELTLSQGFHEGSQRLHYLSVALFIVHALAFQYKKFRHEFVAQYVQTTIRVNRVIEERERQSTYNITLRKRSNIT